MSCRTLLGAVGAAAVLTACVAPLPYDQRVPKTATYQKVDAQWHDELASGAARIGRGSGHGLVVVFAQHGRTSLVAYRACPPLIDGTDSTRRLRGGR